MRNVTQCRKISRTFIKSKRITRAPREVFTKFLLVNQLTCDPKIRAHGAECAETLGFSFRKSLRRRYLGNSKIYKLQSRFLFKPTVDRMYIQSRTAHCPRLLPFRPRWTSRLVAINRPRTKERERTLGKIRRCRPPSRRRRTSARRGRENRPLSLPGR